MPRHSNDLSQHSAKKKHVSAFQNENVSSGFQKTEDEIEYLRTGGKTLPDRPDLESMSTPGTFRTYSHNDEQDGDNDFDSSYGDYKDIYNDRKLEEQFLRGQEKDSEYVSSSEYGTGSSDTKQAADSTSGTSKARPKK